MSFKPGDRVSYAINVDHHLPATVIRTTAHRVTIDVDSGYPRRRYVKADNLTSLDKRPRFYQCGGCGHYHPFGFNGDCRNDEARHSAGELDVLWGPDGWVEVKETL